MTKPFVFILIIAVYIFSGRGYTQSDSLKMLLLDMNVQMESTDAVNDMYNFKFEKAEKQFYKLKERFPKHPLPYFLLGLSQWWKIMPNVDNDHYDDRFLAYMDSAIYFAEELYDANDKNIEAAFFLAAGYGFKGRLYSERGWWRKSTVAGKHALDYLEISKGQNELSPEFLFGDGLYNYFAEWIPENYRFFKSILWLFPDGDKKLGLEQLKEVGNNAFYTRTEAQCFLMIIYGSLESNQVAALPYAKYLAQTFPDNSYFQRFYARTLYYAGYYDEAEKTSLSILQKIDSSYVGYEATSGKYASFFLGQIYEFYKDYSKAKQYYNRALEFTQHLQEFDSGYFLYALYRLAIIAVAQNDHDSAALYYRQIMKYADRDHRTYKAAKDYFAEQKKKKKHRRD